MIRVAVVFVLIAASAVGVLAQENRLEKKVEGMNFKKYIGRPVTRITIQGNDVTKEFVIRREIALEIGEPLTDEAAAKSVSNMMNLDIFSSVTVTPTLDGDGVAVDFDVNEMPWIIPYIKLKYNEENGWSVGPTVTAFNLAGRDIKLSAYALFGGTTTFSFIGSWPWIVGNHLSLDLALEHLNRDDTLNEFEEDSYRFIPWIGTFIGESGRLRGSVGWFQMSSDSAGRTLDPDNTDDFFAVAGSIGYDTRDSWTNPHIGWHNELQIARIGGSGDWTQYIFDVRRYQPMWGKKHTLAMGGLVSHNTGEVGVDFPEYFMYRMGGANSIRGYVLDDLGRVLFGQNQAILTFEYQYLVMPFREYKVIKWPFRAGLQLAAFADYGTAWNNGQSLDGQAKFGAGIGARPLLPGINMLRFDFGVSEDGDVVFNFGVQTKFDAQRLRLR